VTSFHHQPEAQHPKFSAINKNAGRLPHLFRRYRGHSGHPSDRPKPTLLTDTVEKGLALIGEQ
jgi:hypothetical protein